jgi:hypothetical protein
MRSALATGPTTKAVCGWESAAGGLMPGTSGRFAVL